MTPTTSALVCGGCSWRAPDDDPYPFACRGARPGDDIDHVLARVLDLSGGVVFPDAPLDADPFVVFRRLFHSYHLATAHGLRDGDYVELVSDLDDAVARVDGHGFRTTPLIRRDALSDRLGFRSQGGVWVKDETSNVSGSHKGRHLMGTMIYLKVVERLGLGGQAAPRLAIASCGNAALAAAVVAAAGRMPLEVFVPVNAPPAVVARLYELGASVTVCPREDGVPGDPTFARLHAAVAAGALPFTCQGNVNGLAVEGGLTMGYEIASAAVAGGATLDRVFVQVGGGALASSLAGGLAEARALGAIDAEPTLHTVQTHSVFPLKRALDLLRERESQPGEASLRYAASHRSAFMWPWETPPTSLATGILDDETYDWLAVVRAMLRTGGDAHVVSEEILVEANALAMASTGVDVDATGSAGLAGLLQARRAGLIGSEENVAVLFTGARR